MNILAYHTGHDAAVVCLRQGSVVFVREAEKDNHKRHSTLPHSLWLEAMASLEEPEILAASGWSASDWSAPYLGVTPAACLNKEITLFGRRLHYFSDSHERSQIMCAYGLSTFEQGRPCYCLVWEGRIGTFYVIDESLSITTVGSVLTEPGHRYSFLYVLGNTGDIQQPGRVRLDEAGKLMALAAYGNRSSRDSAAGRFCDELLAVPTIDGHLKEHLRESLYYDIGVTSPAFKDIARTFSDMLFDRFYDFAKRHLTRKLPLLISGGCGLNCEWNSRWRECDLFPDVFVPPCANDSGCALGTAIDAMWFYSKQAKVDWSVYCGDVCIEDVATANGFERQLLDESVIAQRLVSGEIIAWIQGRYELGPRALGNRSLLASPLLPASRDKLNVIKRREPFRPIAPVCLEEDLPKHFTPSAPSPHMLYAVRLKHDKLPAITHIDSSARIQSVSERENPRLYSLLQRFKALTGYGVLCNTSLNYPLRGFVNRVSDALQYAEVRGLRTVVVNDSMFSRRVDGLCVVGSDTPAGCSPDI